MYSQAAFGGNAGFRESGFRVTGENPKAQNALHQARQWLTFILELAVEVGEHAAQKKSRENSVLTSPS